MPDSRSERDLLIKLETKFESMNENVSKLDKRFDDFNGKLESAVKEIKDDLKNYVPNKDHEQLYEEFRKFQHEVRNKFVPMSRFEPVEEVHKDISKRIRTLLVSVGVCVLIAAASAPTWIAVYKAMATIQSAQIGK